MCRTSGHIQRPYSAVVKQKARLHARVMQVHGNAMENSRFCSDFCTTSWHHCSGLLGESIVFMAFHGFSRNGKFMESHGIHARDRPRGVTGSTGSQDSLNSTTPRKWRTFAGHASACLYLLVVDILNILSTIRKMAAETCLLAICTVAKFY